MGQSAFWKRTSQLRLGWASEDGPSLQWAKEAILTGGFANKVFLPDKLLDGSKEMPDTAEWGLGRWVEKR
jgi:hypothetical protein